jgi:fermentation-respiration switch protein FrsA (DUF1100 family)
LKKGLLADAAAAYAFAVARYPADRIALWGESLGSAVAIALAADKPVGRIVLEAPFTSAADVGARHYRFVPVRLSMKDQFRSDLRAGKVTAPMLIVHGENDFVVPTTLGMRLYDLIRAPKRFVSVAGGDRRPRHPNRVAVPVGLRQVAGKAPRSFRLVGADLRASTTLGDLFRANPWLCLNCERCQITRHFLCLC